MTENIVQTKKLVAVYCRVSTQNQEKEGTIETQLSAIKEFVSKNNLSVVKEYLDDGWSGDTLERPFLDQLRMDAKKKIWQAVVIYDPDRLARRGAWQEVVIEELKELGIEVLFTTIPPAKTDEDIIMYKMRGVFSEYERMKIKERFRLGKIRKAKEGHILMSQPTYGYNFIKRTPERQGYLEINEKEAQIVRKIFSWVADEGLTIRSVVKKLQDLGIQPRKSKRGVWGTSTLSTMLRSKVYIGEGHFGASIAIVPENPLKNEAYKKIKKTSRKMKSEDEWIKIPTPVIIDKDIFERVGKQLRTNFARCVRNRKNEYLLAGKIWCVCGHRRAGEGALKGKHLYYRCSDRVANFPLPRKCYERGINAKVVDSLLWKSIEKLMSSPELLKAQIDRWVKSRSQRVPNTIISDLDVAKKEIIHLKEQEERYIRAYGAGAFSVEQLKEYSTPIKERITFIENQITKVETEKNELDERILPKSEQVETFTQSVIRTLKNLSFNAKKAIVDVIIDKIISSEREIQVWGYIPITIENHVAFFPKDRHSWAPKCWKINAF